MTDASPSLTDWHALHGDFFQGVRALVTGGAGFIGSHITETLLELGAHVTVLDDLSGSDRANLEPFAAAAGERFRFVQGSILDRALLNECAANCRYVFHQAAMVSVPGSVDDPAAYHAVNVDGTFNVLEAARLSGAQRIMFAASSAAYGDSEVLPKTEDMAIAPKSPYAANKVAGEAMLRAYASSYELDAAPLRYFNIFGTRQNANSAYAAVIAAFAKALAADRRPVIFGDGTQSRDFTYIDNVVHANLLAARCTKRIGGEPLNVACGKRISVNALATRMLELLGKQQLTPEHQPARSGDVMHSLANLTRVREAIGYQPIVGFEQGLAPTVQWYMSVLSHHL